MSLLTNLGRQLQAMEAANLNTDVMGVAHCRLQPTSVVYGGAQKFTAKTVQKLNSLAANFLTECSGAGELDFLLLAPDRLATLVDTTCRQLRARGVEDFRIDFEDGLGAVTDDEEDRLAETAAQEMIACLQNAPESLSLGLRVKSFSTPNYKRSIRTLDRFFGVIGKHKSAIHGRRKLYVTLPKVTHPAQVELLVRILSEIEDRLEMQKCHVVCELVVESPHAFIANSGECVLPRLVTSAGGRCAGLHFGLFDYLASVGIDAMFHVPDHPGCDLPRSLLLATGGLFPGLEISDSVIGFVPKIAHTRPIRENLAQTGEGQSSVRTFLQKLDASMKFGFRQGWDIHPNQLALRAFLWNLRLGDGLTAATERLFGFIESQHSASLTQKGHFDDRASILGVVSFLDRAIERGLVPDAQLDRLKTELELCKDAIGWHGSARG